MENNYIEYEIFLVKGDSEESDSNEYECNFVILEELIKKLGITMN